MSPGAFVAMRGVTLSGGVTSMGSASVSSSGTPSATAVSIGAGGAGSGATLPAAAWAGAFFCACGSGMVISRAGPNQRNGTPDHTAVAISLNNLASMRAKQGRGQPIRTDGPEGHLLTKKGTPTMGGLMILAGVTVSTLLWSNLRDIYVWVVLGVTLGYGVLGFMDDYAKVTKQTSAGLTSWQKLFFQFLIAIVAVVVLILLGPKSPSSPGLETSVAFPFVGSEIEA